MSSAVRTKKAAWLRLGVLVLLLSAALTGIVLLGGCASANPITSSLTVGTGQPGQTTQTQQTAQSAASDVANQSPLGSSPAEAVASKVSPSVVNVRVSGVARTQFFGDQPYEGVGSGVVFSADGYIITNEHVISVNGSTSDSIEVTFSDGEVVPATVVGRDAFSDIAVLKVNKKDLSPAVFASSANIKIGQYAIAIGSPLDYANSVTLGIVSGTGRTIEGSGSTALVDLIQTDAAISPGNSGGAVLNSTGQVIGIAVAYEPPQETGAQNIGFAIPSDTAVSIAQQLISSGKASHAYLGIQYTSVSGRVGQQQNISRSTGVLVTQVGSGTPAAEAGIRSGDVIVSIGDTVIEQEADIVVALRNAQAGETVKVVVDRNGQEETLTVTLGERPAAG